jgi:ribose-phosphate pyrophosphokinase
MKALLNLTDPLWSSVKFKISQFPDGQQSVEIEPESIDIQHSVEIASRLRSFRDLELIICATQAVRNLGVKNVSLYVPYFLGARSDRKFSVGGVNYLKQVICPIINSQNFSKVTVLDPHSDVLEACLNNFEKRVNVGVVSHALTGIDAMHGECPKEDIVIVSPDAGALKKIYDIAKTFELPNVITAGKVRDIATGKILATEVPDIAKYAGKKFLIIDDICDGGRTFIELAKAIKEKLPDAECYLCVTHGIFSAGLKELNKEFKAIFTTNSYIDADNGEFSLRNDNHLHKLHQINVF